MAIQRDTPVSLWVIEILILRMESGPWIGEESILLQSDAPICTTSCFLVVRGQVLKLFFCVQVISLVRNIFTKRQIYVLRVTAYNFNYCSKAYSSRGISFARQKKAWESVLVQPVNKLWYKWVHRSVVRWIPHQFSDHLPSAEWAFQ